MRVYREFSIPKLDDVNPKLDDFRHPLRRWQRTFSRNSSNRCLRLEFGIAAQGGPKPNLRFPLAMTVEGRNRPVAKGGLGRGRPSFASRTRAAWPISDQEDGACAIQAPRVKQGSRARNKSGRERAWTSVNSFGGGCPIGINRQPWAEASFPVGRRVTLTLTHQTGPSGGNPLEAAVEIEHALEGHCHQINKSQKARHRSCSRLLVQVVIL